MEFNLCLKRAGEKFLPLLKNSWGFLLSLWILISLCTMYFEEVLKLDPQRASIVGITATVGLIFTSILESFALLNVLPFRLDEIDRKIAPRQLGPLIKKHVGPLTLESIRVAARVLLWILVFIIPGIIKQIRLSFVPFIVLLNPAYARGDIDALAESETRVKGHTWILFFVMLASFVFDAALEFLTYSSPWLNQFPIRILILFLSMQVGIFTTCIVYEFYMAWEKKQ